LSGSAARYGSIRSRSATTSAFSPQGVELLGERRFGGLLAHGDPCEPIRPLWRPVLERQIAGPLEEGIDDDALRRRDEHGIDQLLVLVASAVTADQLQSRTWKRHVEDACVRRIRHIETHDLAASRGQR
jgi:hypothetical protein